MDHIALMKKSWHLTEKVLSGEKTIESRWYTTRRTPWDSIVAGDTVYFKDSGSPVTVQAIVASVQQIETTPILVKQILDNYGLKIGISPDDKSLFYERFKDKKYCILIFLKDAKPVKPFEINKKGFGNMAAWMCVNDVRAVAR